jgi:hypothetical protein
MRYGQRLLSALPGSITAAKGSLPARGPSQIPNVTLTTFVDFVSAAGTARITKARAAKAYYEQGYSPQRDFYKPLRDRIEDCFENGWNAADLKDLLKEITDLKKVDNYEECRRGLTKWVGRKTIRTLPTRREVWTSGGLEVAVNPELHADINGSTHLIKLYFKADALSKQKADLILHLLSRRAPAGTTVGVLDVRRSTLFVPTIVVPGLDALLAAEALAMVTLWNAI